LFWGAPSLAQAEPSTASHVAGAAKKHAKKKGHKAHREAASVKKKGHKGKKGKKRKH
jgi:hypothetical protein